MRFVVLGGGTAGYIGALTLKSEFPDSDVSVIASKVIGTVGPGEGLTPIFNKFLRSINVTTQEFLDATEGTIKAGINFVGWNQDPSRQYVETFYDPISDIGKETYKKIFLEALGSKNGLASINRHAIAARKKMVCLENWQDFAYHVDANKMIQFFEKKSEEIGIKIIDKIVSGIKTDTNNDIASLIFDDETSIDGDFFIDASGFNRLLIGKHYKSEWISANEYLPVDSAIACIGLADNDPEPFTSAIAMNYGWAWKIPLQHRIGCGYAYDSKYITAEEAEIELRNRLGLDIKVQNKFKFDSGFYRNVLINNTLGLGLASSFFEPLEASSLDRVLTLISNFAGMLKYWNSIDKMRDEYNALQLKGHLELMQLIYMHYRTNKTNTNFWTSIYNRPIPKHIENSFLSLESISDFMAKYDDMAPVHNTTWRFQNWATLFCENIVDEKDLWVDKDNSEEYNSVIQNIKNDTGKFQPHSKYLKNNKQGEK